MDEDVYVVGEDRGTNVKLRRRTGTLKVKTLTERTDDGFELWRTISDSRLPAAKQVWDDALRKLGVERDPGRLQESLDAREIDELCKREGEITCVVTAKRRLFYSREGARIEVTDVAALGMRVTSISFEATDVERARALRTALGGERLGEPENYVSVVARLRRESA